MTATLEAYHAPQSTARGDEALAIIDAHRRTVDDHFSVETLETEFPTFARNLGSDAVYLAHAEDNEAGAFKWRGAFVGAHELANQGYDAMVVPSAGNHARGAILAGKALGMSVHVVVPHSAPPAKREQLAGLWPDPRLSVHTVGQSFDESLAWAFAHPQYGRLLHPYDNPNVVAGQGTLVDDILDEHDDTQHIVVPVGGGGLLAGVLSRLQERDREDIHVHAVEAPGSNSLSLSLHHRERMAAEQPNARFGGSAVRFSGEHARREASSYPNFHLHTVDEDAVDDVIDDYQQDRKELLRRATPNLEPTSLVAVAGLTQVVRAFPDDKIVVVGTGKNDSLRPTNLTSSYRVPM